MKINKTQQSSNLPKFLQIDSLIKHFHLAIEFNTNHALESQESSEENNSTTKVKSP